jgi:hypothetical protein
MHLCSDELVGGQSEALQQQLWIKRPSPLVCLLSLLLKKLSKFRTAQTPGMLGHCEKKRGAGHKQGRQNVADLQFL